MESYSIRWKRSAIKELRKLPKDAVANIVSAVEQLATDPYPVGVRKLAASERSHRLRIGVYRVIYTVEAAELIIEVVRVGHRKDVYRQ